MKRGGQSYPVIAPEPDRRRFSRLQLFGGLALSVSLVPPWLAGLRKTRWSRPMIRAFAGRIMAGCGIKVVCQGAVSIKPGTLYVANHISWADIPLLMTVLDARFVARGDMAGWPVVGGLARRIGTIFVQRESKRSSADQIAMLHSVLTAGDSIILFAEGTTSDGSGVLPFRPTLLAVAQFAAAVQPVCLRYLAPDGSELSASRQREIAWIGDDTLVEGVLRVAGKHTLVRISFLDPEAVSQPFNRKVLAAALHGRVAAAYAALPMRSR